jgi:putative membrane protein
VTWWCSAISEPWTWAFRAYPGIWLMIGLVVGTYTWATVRHARRHGTTAADRRHRVWFALGVVLLWAATDWPLGTLGAAYLSSAHMVQYMLYTLAAAPLLLLGTPAWMARAFADRLHLGGLLRTLAKPVVAGVIFNLVLVATHAPWTVDTFRSNQFGSMVLDLAWIASGLLLWMPVISPLPELRHPSPAVRCVYLFFAAGVMPMIPGGFLTFAPFPLYGTYELAPRVHGFAATDDQQVAGILMKVGSIPVVWTVIFVIFARWAFADRDANVRPDRVNRADLAKLASPDRPAGDRPPATV